MRKENILYFSFLFFLLMAGTAAQAQGRLGGVTNRARNIGRSSGGSSDSLVHRNKFEDSITIFYRFLDSSRNQKLDSSISDWSNRFPVPPTHVYLGNVGTATHSLLYEPRLQSGWDAGFHAFDAYKFLPQQVRFYNTTRPYTELGYILGSQTQQFIEVAHTQNIKPYWNIALRYRLLNAPGFFKNQKSNDNSYVINSWYQSPNKRYNNYFIALGNTLQVGENGGILTDTEYIKNPDYATRFDIPTKLGANTNYRRDLFNTTLATGNRYAEKNIILRQQYDVGRKDSIVTDSTVIPLFYPRLRFEHTFTYGNYKYLFQNAGSTEADSAYYHDNYSLALPGLNDTLRLQDSWREITNDFSIYQFPDDKNLQQFLKAGIAYQFLHGVFGNGAANLYNLYAHGEYRNRTRNKKWEALASGNLYLNGYNAGDYHGYISLERYLGRQWGSLLLGFENNNRKAPFTYDRRSSFYVDTLAQSFGKENTTHFFATVFNPKLALTLGADYYLVGNYLYVTGYNHLQQEGSLFNLLRINASKVARLGRFWRLYSSVWVQQKAGNAQLHLPFFYTRNRLAFEGNFFRNLFLSTGVEVRYNAPYKADGYSPLLGRFTYQDTITIANRPQADLYFNFRIRSFKGYVRAENLNAASFTGGNFGFLNNNFAAPSYPYPGLVIRFGFYWSFVN